jgi:hypothetical protein
MVLLPVIPTAIPKVIPKVKIKTLTPKGAN